MSSDKFKARLKIVMGHDSNSAFAKKCEISESAVRNYLKGQTTPDLDTLEKIAEVSGYSLAWLASGEGAMKRGETGGQAVEQAVEPGRYVLDPGPDLMKEVERRLNATIQKYGVSLSTEKTINLTVTSLRIFDGNYKDLAFRELVMDSIIDNLVKLALPEKK